MYRCGHCPCLHFSADQARHCATVDRRLEDGFIAALIQQSRHGRLPWDFKYEARAAQPMTEAESVLRQHLRPLIGFDSLRVEWWLDELDYRVDLLVPEARLVIEVDGPSHIGREGADLVRAIRIRDAGYVIARATNDDVLARGAQIAEAIGCWVQVTVSALDRASSDAAA